MTAAHHSAKTSPPLCVAFRGRVPWRRVSDGQGNRRFIFAKIVTTVAAWHRHRPGREMINDGLKLRSTDSSSQHKRPANRGAKEDNLPFFCILSDGQKQTSTLFTALPRYRRNHRKQFVQKSHASVNSAFRNLCDCHFKTSPPCANHRSHFHHDQSCTVRLGNLSVGLASYLSGTSRKYIKKTKDCRNLRRGHRP